MAECGVNIPLCTSGGDPLWEYATQCSGWRGVLVEPSAKSFGEILEFYKPYPHAQPMHLAVAGEAGTRMLTSKWGEGNHFLQSHEQGKMAAESVEVVTLAMLWERLRPARVDLLLIGGTLG